jgi:superfamily I DNA/RNA helicase
VVVAGLQAMPHQGEPIDDELRLLYVGMTRATQQLTLTACDASPMVERVEQSLAVVARQFAEMA